MNKHCNKVSALTLHWSQRRCNNLHQLQLFQELRSTLTYIAKCQLFTCHSAQETPQDDLLLLTMLAVNGIWSHWDCPGMDDIWTPTYEGFPVWLWKGSYSEIQSQVDIYLQWTSPSQRPDWHAWGCRVWAVRWRNQKSQSNSFPE